MKQYIERYGKHLRPVITALLHWAFVERILDAKAWTQTVVLICLLSRAKFLFIGVWRSLGARCHRRCDWSMSQCASAAAREHNLSAWTRFREQLPESTGAIAKTERR